MLPVSSASAHLCTRHRRGSLCVKISTSCATMSTAVRFTPSVLLVAAHLNTSDHPGPYALSLIPCDILARTPRRSNEKSPSLAPRPTRHTACSRRSPNRHTAIPLFVSDSSGSRVQISDKRKTLFIVRYLRYSADGPPHAVFFSITPPVRSASDTHEIAAVLDSDRAPTSRRAMYRAVLPQMMSGT